MTQVRVKHALNTFNLLLVATFLVLALYSALGQQIFPFIGQYRIALQSYISEQLQSPIEIRHLSGGMDVFTPSVHIEGISMGEQGKPVLSIAAVDAELDPRLSLLNLTPVFTSVRLSGVSIKIDPSAASSTDDNQSLVERSADGVQRFVESLLLQQHLELNNVSIDFPMENKMQTVTLDHLVMTGDGFSRLMTGSVSYGKEKAIHTGFRLFTQGSPYNLEEFYARGHMDLPQLDVNYWLEKLFKLDVFDEFNSSSQLNFEFSNGLLNYAKLTASSPKVSIDQDIAFEDVKSEVWLKQNNTDTWSLWLGNGEFSLNNVDWQLNDVAIKVSRTLQGNRWQGYVEEMDLVYLQGLLSALGVVPNTIKNILNEVNATGKVKQFSVILQQQEGNSPQITAAGHLDGVSIDSYIGIPKLENVSGVLAANQSSGRIQLDTNNTKLYLDTLYAQPFDIEKGQGQIDWFIQDHQIHVSSKGLDLAAKEIGKVKGGFQIWLPKKLLDQISLELNLSFKDVNLLANQALIPDDTVPSLKQWLGQSLKYGNVKDGMFYLYGDLDKTDPLFQLQLYLNAENSALSYLDEWPLVTQAQGQLFIDNDLVLGQFSSGNTQGGEINQLELLFEDDVLWLEGGVVGDSKGLFSYLQNTPLSGLVNNVFESWNVEGRHFSELALKVPFQENTEILAEVHSGLSQTHLHMNNLDLGFNFINGQVSYTTRKGLTSDSLTASFWQRPFNIAIDSSVKDKDLKTNIEFSGSAGIDKLKSWLKLPLLEPISGQTKVKGQFVVNTNKDDFTGLQLTSELKGVSVDLPGDFKKSAQSSVPFKTEIELKDDQNISLYYGDKAALYMTLKDGELFSGHVLSPVSLADSSEKFSMDPGFYVDAKVDAVKIEDWLKTWDKILLEQNKYPSNQAGDNPLKKVNLAANTIIYDDLILDDVKTEISHDSGQWTVAVDAPIAKGVLKHEVNKPLDVDLDYFHWSTLAEESPQSDNEDNKNTDPLEGVYPHTFPKLNLSVDEIYVDSTNYGRWQMQVLPLSQGVHLKNIDGYIKELSVKGDVHWVKPTLSKAKQKSLGKKEFTEAKLSLSSKNLAGIQAAWRSKPAVEAEKTNANVAINWPSSPAGFDIKTAKGDIELSLKDGRFLEAGEASALSAFGILNFSAIGRRLRLDFTDVYESGLHFDDVKGKARIEDGVITIVDTLNIEGPSAKFAASGSVNTITKALDQELSVTFPLSSTLPFVAILAGFAPPVAASLFVGERLVGDEIERFTSATYELTGSWDDPQLKLKKRFDNEIEGKKDRSFWHRMKDVFGVGE